MPTLAEKLALRSEKTVKKGRGPAKSKIVEQEQEMVEPPMNKTAEKLQKAREAKALKAIEKKETDLKNAEKMIALQQERDNLAYKLLNKPKVGPTKKKAVAKPKTKKVVKEISESEDVEEEESPPTTAVRPRQYNNTPYNYWQQGF